MCSSFRCKRVPHNACMHCARVLRMREGDALEVCDGAGTVAAGELRGITARNKAYVETTAGVTQVPTPPLLLALGRLGENKHARKKRTECASHVAERVCHHRPTRKPRSTQRCMRPCRWHGRAPSGSWRRRVSA